MVGDSCDHMTTSEIFGLVSPCWSKHVNTASSPETPSARHLYVSCHYPQLARISEKTA